ncbi:MAG: hypothetical protein HY913_05295 [Desulfomonile tiedjei]|nr:hypothetical protein [Desulfomonile tiedjei]
MDEEFRWPKKGDNPFLIKAVEPGSPTWASQHFDELMSNWEAARNNKPLNKIDPLR